MNSVSGYKFTRVAKKSAAAYRAVPVSEWPWCPVALRRTTNQPEQIKCPELMSTRILIVGNALPGNLETSYERAFRQLGCEAEVFSLARALDAHTRLGRAGRVFNRFVPVEAWVRKANRDLVMKVIERQPSVVLIIGQQPVRLGALAQLQTGTSARVGLVWPDPLVNLEDSLASCLPVLDAVFTYSERSVGSFRRLGAGFVEWVPLAGDPQLHAPATPSSVERAEYGADVTFIGGWRPERETVLTGLAGLDLKIWGPEWDRRCAGNAVVLKAWQGRPLVGAEFATAVATSKVNLNIIDPSNPSAANMRFFEIPMAGGLQVCSACPEMSGVFRDGEHLFYYQDAGGLRTLLQRLLSQEPRCRTVAAVGQALALSAHTYRHRAERILSALA